MSERGPHPFPPVVRWALFPVLAGAAGAAAGWLAAALVGYSRTTETIGIGATWGLGAAMAAALSPRPWIALGVAPLLAVLILCSGMSALSYDPSSAARYRPPADILRRLLEDPSRLIFFAGVPWLQAAAHVLGLRRLRAAPGTRVFHYYGLAALAGLALALLSMDSRWLAVSASVAACTTILQILPLKIAAGLARRWNSNIVH